MPFDAELQYLKPQLLEQTLVHHKFVMDLPDGIWIGEKTGKTAPCRVMAVKAYSRAQAKFWYVDFTIIAHADRCDLQLPVRKQNMSATIDAWRDSPAESFRARMRTLIADKCR